jgi:hypothetical protein
MPTLSALAGSNFGVPASLPGFGTLVNVDNRVLSVQEIHTFNPTAVNESRFGYSFLRHDEVLQESVEDASLGTRRSTAAEYPGLPLMPGCDPTSQKPLSKFTELRCHIVVPSALGLRR